MHRIDAIRVMAPLFNCAETLRTFIQNGDGLIRPIITMQRFFARKQVDFEFFALNDGSTDEGAQILDQLAHDLPWFHHMESDGHYGIITTLRAGYSMMLDGHTLKHVPYQNVALIRLNANLEHDPWHILSLVSSITDHPNHGAVYQLRYQTEHQPAFSYSLNGVMSLFQHHSIGPPQGHFHQSCPQYNAYRGDAINNLLPLYDSYIQIYAREYGRLPECGADLIMLFLAYSQRYRIDCTLSSISVRQAPYQSIDMLLREVNTNTGHFLLMQKIKQGQYVL